ncbi:MAG: glucose 1-dehydrogenase [Candidatus Korobacteraceae bacterium]|jgi:2-deoxy-D-gluconate 3-dehydrogenase
MKFPTCSLQGKVAIATGGSKGIGYGMALALAQSGADMAIASRHLEESQKAAEDMRQFGGRAIGLCCDVTSVKSIDEMVEKVMAHYGKIDILLNNAGMNIRKPIVEVQEEDWDRVIDTNLKGVFFVARRVAMEMIKQKSGKIINIGSVCSSVGIRQLGIYTASKGGVAMLTKVMALEWAPYNIQANAIAPPYVRTPMTTGWMTDPVRLKWIIDSTPLGRLGEIDDLAGPVVFLAGDMSDFVTGHLLSADGGWIAQ